MADSVKVTMTSELVSGYKMSVSHELPAGAYDVIEVPIKKTDTDREVKLSPGPGVLLLQIRSSNYGANQKRLTFKTTTTGTPKVFTLDAPLLLVGGEAIASLLDNAPASLFFTNGTTEDVQVQVLIVRNPMP